MWQMASTNSRIESTVKDAFRKVEATGGKHDFCHGYRDHRIYLGHSDRTVCSDRNCFFFQQEKDEWGNGQKAHMVSQAARTDRASRRDPRTYTRFAASVSKRSLLHRAGQLAFVAIASIG